MEHHAVRNYREGDEYQIITLFAEVFEKNMSLAQWRWKYPLPGYSVVAVARGEIIGHAGAIPLKGLYKGKTIPFFQIADVMVHPRERGYLGRRNVFGKLLKTLLDNIRHQFEEVFCYGFPGRRPFRLGERMHVYERLENARLLVKRLPSPCRIPPFHVAPLPWEDQRINTLWNQLSPSFCLTLARDQSYLKWRYQENPFFSYHLLGLFHKSDLQGWAVMRRTGDDASIVDLLASLQDMPQVLVSLWHHLSTSGDTPKQAQLWLPSRLRDTCIECELEETEAVVAHMTPGSSIPPSLARPCLFYTMGDADIF